MSDQAGLTIDTGVVDNGDGDYIEDDDGTDGIYGVQPEPISSGPSADVLTDRTTYSITRAEGDPLGNPLHIDYENGESVEFVYDNNGVLQSVVDTSSGTRMINTEDGWVLQNKKGERTPIDGEVSVDPATGAVVTKMNDGTTYRAEPDGRVVATNADGQISGVSRPSDFAFQGELGAITRNDGSSRTGFSQAQYDQDGNLTSVTDAHGNVYQRKGDGWTRTAGTDAASVPVSGTVCIDNHGMYVVPES